jgi:hypothetical protein
MDTHDRLEETNKRAMEIYAHIGYMSTHFAGLELTVLKLLAKIINPNSPGSAWRSLSRLSFKQSIDDFVKEAEKILPTSEAIKETKSLAKRLRKAGRDRNDIIHSSWIAYTKGNYGQHRARLKDMKMLPIQTHKNNPVAYIDKVTDSIYSLIFDLACFEDRIIK